MGDFNAQLGEPCPDVVGDLVDNKTTSNGEYLLQLLKTTGMWLPSTYSYCHSGEQGTWLHPTGKRPIRLDYVSVDNRFAAHNVSSEVDQDLDHPGNGEDHSALKLEFSFLLRCGKQTRSRVPIDEMALTDPSNKEKIEAILHSIAGAPWAMNVHDHYACIAFQLYQELSHAFPQKRKRPRKHYISQATWLCRASKLAMRRAMRSALKLGDADTAEILGPQLRQATSQLRYLLQEDRRYHVDALLGQVDTAEPSQLFAQLRRLGIGAATKKYSNKALPMMKMSDDTYATSYQESQLAWKQHASSMEGGYELRGDQLLQQCADRQRQHQAVAAVPHACNIPTKTQLERACRKLRPFKARGPDGLPAGLFHYYPALMANLIHPLMVKIACYTSEPLGFKGGKLVHLYKGRGPPDEPSNRRGILISNHMSKVAHGALRGQFTPFLEKGMLPMQVGGRAHKSVQQGAHMLRLYMDLCKRQAVSCGVVFLDIRTAYYKVLRELVANNGTVEGRLQALLSNFNLPPSSLQALEQRLSEGPAITTNMGLNDYMTKLLSEIHTDTWFTTPGLEGLTGTTVGTRPGSCFADVFFNFLFAEVLHQVKEELAEYGVMTELGWSGHRGLQMDPRNTEVSEVTVETAWADDLALFFQHPDPNQLVGNLQAGCAVLLNACLRYGLEPNFSKGKTEALVALRGRGAVQARRHWFTQEGGRLPLPGCAIEGSSIRMVARYRHLGGQVDAKATTKAEVKARVGQTRQVFKRYKKSLFQATTIQQDKRAQLVRPFVLSVLEYNLGTLVSLTASDKQYVATALLGIYKAIWKPKHADLNDHKVAWPRLCYALQLPTPTAVLQMARARYFSQIYRYGDNVLWALISTQQGWLQECAEAFAWVYKQLAGSTRLPDPQVDWAPWAQLIQNQPKRFSALLQRAWKHEVLQEYNEQIVKEGYKDFAEAMEIADFDFLEPSEKEIPMDSEHACLACSRLFGSRTGWASHAFKCHGRTISARQYAGGTHCLACNTEYWEYKRLLHHLKYSSKCRRKLARAGMEVEQEPGIGSRHQKRQPEELLQPWITTPGGGFTYEELLGWGGVPLGRISTC